MNTATSAARLVVDQLVGWGVTDAVLAPGSRSAPLAYALETADRRGQLRLHVRIDERGAGFLALGLARATGRCVPVVTTSGTAAANLHPAVLEARHSGVPLLVVTADRPTALRDRGANQTTTQNGLYAAAVRAEAQLDAADQDPAGWRHQLARLVTAAQGLRTRTPGPVHLNLGLVEPLLPPADDLDGPGPAVAGPAVVQAARPDPPEVLPAGPPTVVLVGDARPAVGAAAVALARASGLPLLAEPSSNARVAEAVAGYRLLLGDDRPEAVRRRIERVIMVGHPTLSRPVTRLLGRSDVELVVVADGAEWVDPGARAARVCDAVRLDGPGDPGWLAAWRDADRALRPRVEAVLAGAGVTGPAVAERVWRSSGADDVLVAGSSNPIRDLDLAGPHPAPPEVHANRGLAGIDGTLSTAIGIALGTGRPTTALVGDLTFLHDVTALAVGPAEPRPDLRIVVVNDDGGSIFATLEQGGPDHAGPFERVFGTPHHADLGAICAGFGVPFRRATTLDELDAVLATPPRGLEVVEVPLDRTRRRDLDAALRALVR
ncbi:2-succinyl-5-enolpyruvyl-6-hydroxy-3-cyclohexene-1-carboxylate synthase [Friedmanniella endophytica]|uniref:2-succinyl-5-enolpyruvyl-6-hydroxy-3-cyclohexene-1-carboxylate synthase n=1 Tax=Microlunatus kandeliicorticis TaxID=1759536 RepID=A0A7W3P4G0_9ACTN|nr:2-succinyl-5-enolpyruvyl-6-hydroxy-3-cyclohexene-1-carboxylic-acid synthase [Microlunatus kandeliicorticis]MBA8792765.1 2-succinyl-5-enolpyruvyl-6-hydroxy-3-cyclohexene-1-carboxylate synthase [Microlunatus kandeliicorticis]